jgi:hypothetical protein
VERPDPLVALLDEARASERAAGRTRAAWLRRQAEEGATLAGALLVLAEAGSVVSARTTSGRVSHGVVAQVATDFVVLRSERGDVCISFAAISTVRLQEGERHRAPTGSRPPALDLLLVEVLAGLAPERPRVAVGTTGDGVVAGELLAVGADVVTVRLDGDGRTLCYVAVTAVEEVVLPRASRDPQPLRSG